MSYHGIRVRRVIWVAAVVAVVMLAGYVRLGNLGDNPAWFTDEGSNLEVAQRLREGKMEYMALGQSTLMVSRMVIFEEMLAGALTLGGDGIGTLRALTGALGVVSVATLFFTARRITGRPVTALAAALGLAIYPQAVITSRFGFSYNLLAPLMLIVLLGLWEYTRSGRRGWLALAAGAAGLGAVSDVWMLAVFAPAAVAIGLRRPRDLLWALPVMALPLGVYLAFLVIHAPEAAWMDIRFVLLRVSDLSPGGQAWNAALNFTVLLSQDFWMPCAVIGFLAAETPNLRRVALLMFVGPMAIIGRTVALYGLSEHYMIPLLPLAAFGAALLAERGTRWMWQTASHRWAMAAVCAVVIGTPVMVTLALDLEHVQGGFPTPIDPFLTNPGDARKTAEFINAHVRSDDLVIVSPAISWLIHAHTADIQMAIAATGVRTVHFPAGIPAGRWVYDPRVEKVRYVVVDDFWRGWGAANVDGLSALLERVGRWPRVFEAGGIQVFANPDVK